MKRKNSPRRSSGPASAQPAAASGATSATNDFLTRLADPRRLSVGLFAVVLVVFLRSLRGEFLHFDEVWHVTQNAHVNTGWSWPNFVWAFRSLEAANWYPLTWLSHMTDCQLFGMQPWGHHLTSIVIHAINTALVFLVLRSLTGATWRSFAVAILFGLHPLRVESVAWISERKDVLSLMFWLLSMWSYARYARAFRVRSAGAGRFYWMALGLFACGLMSKPTVVTLPCVLFLLDFWPLGRIPGFAPQISRPAAAEAGVRNPGLGRLILEKAPFFVLVGIDSVLTSIAQKEAGMLTSYDTAALGLPARLANALVSYARYIGKTFWPVDLCTLYPHPGHWPAWLIALGGALVFGIGALGWRFRREKPYLFTGLCWYIGTLVPMIGVVQAGPQSMADRYTYIPSIGLLLALVWALAEITRDWRRRMMWLAGAGGVAAIACSAATFHQIAYWRDGLTVWNRAIAVTENNYIAHNNLATEFADRNQLEDTVRELQETLRINPTFVEANHLMGDKMSNEGRFEEAIRYYRKVLERDPERIVVRNNLGYTLIRLGRFDEAMKEFEIILRRYPKMEGAENNLGYALSMKGRFPEAEAHLRKAIQLDPNVAVSHNTLGYVLFELKDMAGAEHELREVLRIDPNFMGGYNNLGHVLFEQGRLDEAIEQFQESVRRQPANQTGRENLAAALALKNRTQAGTTNAP
jgi:tetratricopeptide (TPR) repeat protein